MNDFQVTLWNDLSNLSDNNDSFLYKDFQLGTKLYRVFAHRLASYSDFCEQNALNSRGTMFEIDQMGAPVRLAAFPMEKFFNKDENPLTTDLDLSEENIDVLMSKEDGSLISTFIHFDDNAWQLRCKSKTSLFSDQAQAAETYLNAPQNAELKSLLMQLTQLGTVNLEYVAPWNKIVVSYTEERLIVLNVRSRTDGKYLDAHVLLEEFPELNDYWVKEHSASSWISVYDNMEKDKSDEGLVIRLKNHQHVKIKTDWYLTIHRAKDTINNNRKLFEVILDEKIDDLKPLFAHDPVTTSRIAEMETLIKRLYHSLNTTVESFYRGNNDLSRKDFAIKGQLELTKIEFSAAMLLYSGKSPDYISLLKKNYQLFGISDEDSSPSNAE